MFLHPEPIIRRKVKKLNVQAREPEMMSIRPSDSIFIVAAVDKYK